MEISEKLQMIQDELLNPDTDSIEKMYNIAMISTSKSDVIIKKVGKKLSLKEVEQQMFFHTGLTLEQINIKSRKREIVTVRQMAHFKAYRETKFNLSAIGSYFGNKDHCTVIYSCKTIQNLLDTDKDFRKEHAVFLGYEYE